MPKVIKPLTANEINSLSPGYTAVGGVPGLYIQVLPGESKARTWIFRYTDGRNSNGKQRRREIGLGSASTVKLSKARELAADLRRKMDTGEAIGPIPKARAQLNVTSSVPTFEEASLEVFKALSPTWKSEVHRKQWLTNMQQDVYPKIGRMRVDQISVDSVMSVLKPIWNDKPTTADRIRERLHAVLEWAEARGLRNGPNPARWKGLLKNLLPDPRKVKRKENHPALPFRDVPAFLRVLAEQRGVSALALRLLILTGLRTSEVLLLRWREIDFQERTIQIPAERMKADRPHVVPLTSAVLDLLNAVRNDHPELVFLGNRSEPLSNAAMSQLIHRINERREKDGLSPFVDPKYDPPRHITPHGFRSSFRDWAGDSTEHAREVVELCLAHSVGNAVENAYRRGDMLERRRVVMEEWASHCMGG